jgi:alpha-N-arabinofuranosidase
MAAVPEFILRKLYVQGSLKAQADGFSFALNNSFAPATVTGFQLSVDGSPAPPGGVSIQAEEGPPRLLASIIPQSPQSFSVNVLYTIHVQGMPLGQGRLRLVVDTVEAGQLQFSIQTSPTRERRKRRQAGSGRPFLRRLFPTAPLKADVHVDTLALVGEISPFVYGHFIEHLERCIYGGIWSEDGSRLRADSLNLIKALHPPLMRYPGGNFASGYHWEDGIGPQESRPPRFDRAWSAPESNRVGTDEFMAFCWQVQTTPFLVVNDGSGTPEEAARWVAYCNQPATTEQGRRRAANGVPQPYDVRVWGVGNEVWGEWQIGHTGAEEYAARLRKFVDAMRSVDPNLRIVAVGDKVMSDAPSDPGRRWNEVILRQAGDLIDDLSFHLYQPDREGWLEQYDLEALHHTVCAAPLDAEAIIQRIDEQIALFAPGRKIGVAFDEWNLWLTPPAEARSMHQLVYTLRDGLYAAGMFHAFHRQCNAISMANLAQLVNVLPAIVTDEYRAYPTPLYHAFWLYQHMQPLALRSQVDVKTFDSQALGNISAHQQAPYLDVTATRSQDGTRLALGLINRHPERRIQAQVGLAGAAGLQVRHAWQLCGPHALASNSFDQPDRVRVIPVDPPELRGDRLASWLPPASVSVFVLEKLL